MNNNIKKILTAILIILLIFFVVLVALFLLKKHFHLPYLLSVVYPHQYTFTKQNKLLKANNKIIYGVNAEMSQLLPESSKYLTNDNGEDLIDIAAKLGINMFRITNTTRARENDRDAIYSKEDWNSVLDKMQSKGIKAIILIETASSNREMYNSDIKPVYLRLVNEYVIESGVLSHPNVYAIDLKNEPIINNQNNIDMIEQAARMIKETNPQTRLTVGYWRVDTFQKDQDGSEIYDWEDYAGGKDFENIVDFYSIHVYGFDRESFGFYPDPYEYTRSTISEIKSSLQTQKPILIGEFGAANGQAISDQLTIGSPELQANTYQGVYQAINDVADSQIMGTVAYQLNAKTDLPDSWAVLKNNGNTILPAALILQKYAKVAAGTTIAPPFKTIPKNYLFTNAHDQSSQSIQTGDIIGLKLSLPEKPYDLMLSNENLEIAEPLTLNPGNNKYYVVLHAVQSGETRISIAQRDQKVFSLTIIIK